MFPSQYLPYDSLIDLVIYKCIDFISIKNYDIKMHVQYVPFVVYFILIFSCWVSALYYTALVLNRSRYSLINFTKLLES